MVSETGPNEVQQAIVEEKNFETFFSSGWRQFECFCMEQSACHSRFSGSR